MAFQRIHILGIGGTFMSGIALLAKALGFQVYGSDKALYSPTKDILDNANIPYVEYGGDLPDADLYLVGNALSRGHPWVEALLRSKKPMLSAPEWLQREVLSKRKVIALAGTHGKTTTTSLVSWVLHELGLSPGYLIGGLCNQIGSANLGLGDYFVIEADEYDTAFFDKRSKFVHYWPSYTIINNIEFDHADIFSDLNAVKFSFHQLIRATHPDGMVLTPSHDMNINDVIEKGLWSEHVDIDDVDLRIEVNNQSGSSFSVFDGAQKIGSVNWCLAGRHHLANAKMVLALCKKLNLNLTQVCDALSSFPGIKRRLELIYESVHIKAYEDFAHHPTAIKETLDAFSLEYPGRRLMVAIEAASNTMRLGHHKEALAESLEKADMCFCLSTSLQGFSWEDILPRANVFEDGNLLREALVEEIKPGDVLIILSNGAFKGVRDQIADVLQALRK